MDLRAQVEAPRDPVAALRASMPEGTPAFEEPSAALAAQFEDLRRRMEVPAADVVTGDALPGNAAAQVSASQPAGGSIFEVPRAGAAAPPVAAAPQPPTAPAEVRAARAATAQRGPPTRRAPAGRASTRPVQEVVPRGQHRPSPRDVAPTPRREATKGLHNDPEVRAHHSLEPLAAHQHHRGARPCALRHILERRRVPCRGQHPQAPPIPSSQQRND